MAYLDSSGVTQLTSEIKNLADASYLRREDVQSGLPYGVCETERLTAEKTVTIEGVTELTAGLTIAVKFININTASNPTLNVNNLGAKYIMRTGELHAGATSDTTGWEVGSVVILVYDGDVWLFNKGYNSNTTYTVTPVDCRMSGATAAKVSENASNYVLKSGNIFECSVLSANTYRAALTLNINNTGVKPIYINGAPSSASNYSIPAGKYLVHYDGNAYQFRTDGKAPINITGTVNGYNIGASVPTGAKFLPSVTASDNGKVLRVSNGVWEKGDIPGGSGSLPTGGTQGQVLTKNSNTDGDAGWSNIPTELPPVTASDNGKVLQVANGVWSKGNAPSGGGGSLPTGGTVGQILTKNSATDGDAGWADGPSTMIVTFTLPSGGGSVYTSDKTFAEVLAAIEHGWTVLGKANGKLYSMIYYESASIKFHSTWMEMRDADTFNENVTIYEHSIYMLTSMNVAYDLHSVNVTPNAPGVYHIELDDNPEPDDESDLYYVSASNIGDIGQIFGYYNYGTDVNNSNIFLRYRGGTYEDAPSDLYQLTQKYTTEENGNYIGHCVFQCIAENNGSVVLKQFTISDMFEQYFSLNDASVTYSERVLGGGGGGSIPAGGAAGQVLTKNSATDGDAGWSSIPTELPSVTASDNGKVLQVANGAWSKGDVPTELPSVTVSDNGKVLQVANGVWSKESISGGGSLPAGGTQGQVLTKNSSTDGDAGWVDVPSNNFYVTVTYNLGTNWTYVSDKTFAEVYQAIQGGKNVYLIYNGSIGYIYTLRNYDSTNAYFTRESVGSYSVDQYVIRIYQNGNNTSVSYTSNRMQRETIPYPLNPSECVRVWYDQDMQSYRASTSSFGDISDFFNYELCNIYLEYGSPTSYEEGDSGDNTDAHSETYRLVNRYTTNVYDENEGYTTWTGHLIFKAVSEESGTTKVKTFTITDSRWNYWDSLDGATVTYSEEELGGSGSFVVTISGNNGMYQHGTNYTADHTVSEIYNAYLSGQTVEARFITNPPAGNEFATFHTQWITSNSARFVMVTYGSGSLGNTIIVREFSMSGANSTTATMYIANVGPQFCPDQWRIDLSGDGQTTPFSLGIFMNGDYYSDEITSLLFPGNGETRDGFKHIKLVTGYVTGDYQDDEIEEFQLNHFHCRRIYSGDQEWESEFENLDEIDKVSFSFYTIGESGGNMVAKTVKIETMVTDAGGYLSEYSKPDYRTITYTETPLGGGGGTPAAGVSF